MNPEKESMKLRTLIAAVANLLLCLPVISVHSAAVAQELSVDRGEHDFGNVYRGHEARHNFRLTNTGDDTLKITNVRSSCGCTVPAVAKRNLAPGESTDLTAMFVSGRKGPVTKNIYVYSNDETDPVTKLTIHANVQQDIQVSPNTIYFAGLKSGESVQREIEIRNVSEQKVKISEIASTVSALEIQLDKMVLEPQEAAKLSLRIPEVEKGMKLTGELTIFNTSREDELKVRLYGGVIK
jgi:hypothetical protein